MLRLDHFLERAHRVLSIPGVDSAAVGRAIDDLLQGCGDFMPRKIHAAAQALQIALVRGGVLAARVQLESIRVIERTPRVSGVFEGPLARGRSPSRILVVRHRLLRFERDDHQNIQLLCLDGPTPFRVGQRRHMLFAHHLYLYDTATYAEAIEASGSESVRSTRLLEEARRYIGHEWFVDSDSGRSQKRIIRFRANRDVPGAEVYEHRVRALTPIAG
jgi:hypothetical protein